MYWKEDLFISLFFFIAFVIRFPFVSAVVRINGFYNQRGNYYVKCDILLVNNNSNNRGELVELPQEDCVFLITNRQCWILFDALIKQICLFFRHFRFYHRNMYAPKVNTQLFSLLTCIV